MNTAAPRVPPQNDERGDPQQQPNQDQRERNKQAQADATPTPRQVATQAPPRDAVESHAALSVEQQIGDDEEAVHMVVPKSFVLNDEGRRYAFLEGVRRVPARLAGHWYLKANGVVNADDVAQNHKVIRDREDAELADRRAKEDAEIAARRTEEDRAEMQRITDEQDAARQEAESKLNAGGDRASASSTQSSFSGQLSPDQQRQRDDEQKRRADARKREDSEIAKRRAAADKTGAPTADVIEARKREDAELAQKRAQEDQA